MFSPFGMMGMPMMPPMMMPMMAPTPGVVPGMPGMGYYNSLPGRFGRDMLGRDFAGPGGVGSSQPYRPPDPSALPPMPFGLPFVARPGQEGFDAYGRMLPPEVPEGWDGWGRPIVAATSQQMPAPAAAPNVPPQGMPPGGAGAGGPASAAGYTGGGGAPLPPGTRDMPLSTLPPVSAPWISPPVTGTGTGSTDRPEQPECFDRPPAQTDSYYRYCDFEAFSLPSHALNHPWELHLPRELVSHDVTDEDWARFIDDLAKESVHQATHDWGRRNRGVLGLGPHPVLSDSVHSLLVSWAVAFFAPRGIRIYAAAEGRRIVPPPLEPGSSRRGVGRADEWSDSEGSTIMDDDDTEWELEEAEERAARRNDMYLPKREREVRRSERARQRRRNRRHRMEQKAREGLAVGGGRSDGLSRGGRTALGGGQRERGEWEVHFVCMTPTIWTPGARPRTYGEPVRRSRR